VKEREGIMELTETDARLVAALRDGLPVTARPYAALGERLGLSEATVLARLTALREAGVVRRFGAIVRHRALGYTANAMCVFDVPDAGAADLGRRAARHPGVTLCYRRRRAAGWPYNLYCMIHGRDHGRVLELYEALADDLGVAEGARAILFSRRCFKQTAGCYGRAAAAGSGAQRPDGARGATVMAAR